MSSTIKLYEHNQKAYDALLDMLGERDRACVIMAGTQGRPLYDGLRLHGLGDRYEQHLL